MIDIDHKLLNQCSAFRITELGCLQYGNGLSDEEITQRIAEAGTTAKVDFGEPLRLFGLATRSYL